MPRLISAIEGDNTFALQITFMGQDISNYGNNLKTTQKSLFYIDTIVGGNPGNNLPTGITDRRSDNTNRSLKGVLFSCASENSNSASSSDACFAYRLLKLLSLTRHHIQSKSIVDITSCLYL